MPTPDDYYDPGAQPNWRNFTPPSTTPSVFNTSDPYGRISTRTTESSTRDGNPQATQTAQAPPPTPGTLITDGGVPGLITNRAQGTPTPLARQLVAAGVNPPNAATMEPTPPTPAAYRPSPLYQPLPWRTQQPPPAQPAPPVGDWDHENEHPDMPQPRPIPAAAQPNRDPDGYHNGRPVYHLRPGEQGYGVGGSNSLSGVVAKLESDYGRDNAAQPRSMANPTYGQYPGFVATYGSGPQGITNYANQILRYNPNATLADFYAGYAQGTGNPAHPPTIADLARNYPAYYSNLVKNSPYPISTPLASLMGGVVAGPPQAYVPPRGREPSQWGEPPDNEWTPGRMPTQHDVPGIMKGLLPLIGTILIGFAGKGALGAVTAFGAYQNARNKGQLEAAKEQKDLWKDSLSETTSRLKEEMIAAQGVMADYPDASSPQAQMAWRKLAATFDDSQLSAALDSNDMKRVEDLFKRRDSVFQTLSKTSAAATKADEQNQAKSDEAAMGFPQEPGSRPAAPGGVDWSMGGGRGAQPAAPAGAPAAPSAPAAPEDGQPQPPSQPGEQPPSGAPAPDTGQPPPPADGRPPQVAPRPPATGPAGAGAAPPTGRPGPAYTPGPGEAPPLPDVNVTAPTPPPPTPPAEAPAAPASTAPAYSAPRTPFDAMVSQIVNGEEVEKFKPAISADGLKKLQAAAADKINRIEAVKPGPDAAAQLKAIDPTFGSYAEGVAHYNKPDPTSRANVGRDYVARMYDSAQKINPQWTYQNFKTLEDFRESFNPEKPVGQMFGRTQRLADLSRELADDANKLPNTNVASFNQLVAWFQSGVVGDPRYTKFINDWRLFANDAQAIASGTGKPPVTLTSHLIDTLQQGAKPEMIRQGLKEDVIAALASINSPLSGWHRAFQGEANPFIFDQRSYAELNQYAHMNIDNGAVPEALPDVGYSQRWGGQTHYYLGGDITNKLNWSLKKPPGDQ